MFSHSLSSMARGTDAINHVIFVTFIFVIAAALWHPKMKLVIHAIVGYWDVWDSASDFRCLKRNFRGHMVNNIRTFNLHCCHADDHTRC
jgi:hypothetical protein